MNQTVYIFILVELSRLKKNPSAKHKPESAHQHEQYEHKLEHEPGRRERR